MVRCEEDMLRVRIYGWKATMVLVREADRACHPRLCSRKTRSASGHEAVVLVKRHGFAFTCGNANGNMVLVLPLLPVQATA